MHPVESAPLTNTHPHRRLIHPPACTARGALPRSTHGCLPAARARSYLELFGAPALVAVFSRHACVIAPWEAVQVDRAAWSRIAGDSCRIPARSAMARARREGCQVKKTSERSRGARTLRA